MPDGDFGIAKKERRDAEAIEGKLPRLPADLSFVAVDRDDIFSSECVEYWATTKRLDPVTQSCNL